MTRILSFQAFFLLFNFVLHASYCEGALVDSQIETMNEFTTSLPLFHEWSKKHNKEYDSIEEESKSYKVWFQNHQYIQQHNNQKPPPPYLLGHNQFSDLTEEEYHKTNFLDKFSPGVISFSKKKGNLRGEQTIHNNISLDTKTTAVERKLHSIPSGNDYDLPISVDWVKDGAVTSVKNQGLCGACWAFSAVSAIEGARVVQARKEGLDNVTLVSLSEQELLDCDYADHSCLGGLMDNAFEFGEKIDGFCSDKDYPYAMRRHHLKGCRAFKDKCTPVPHTKISSFTDITNTTEALMGAISIQPVSVAIQASGVDFQLYSGGILDVECGTDLDHGVTAVGYGEEDGQKYWLVKNSWGTKWGEEGYFKLSFNSSNADDEGQCGILMMASFPILDF
jgi:C1A family cysteine protease